MFERPVHSGGVFDQAQHVFTIQEFARSGDRSPVGQKLVGFWRVVWTRSGAVLLTRIDPPASLTRPQGRRRRGRSGR